MKSGTCVDSTSNVSQQLVGEYSNRQDRSDTNGRSTHDRLEIIFSVLYSIFSSNLFRESVLYVTNGIPNIFQLHILVARDRN